MKRRLLLVILTVLALSGVASAQPRVVKLRKGIRWRKTLDDALAEAARADAPLAVFCTLSNHGASLRFEERVLADRTFRRLAGLFVMVRLDGRLHKDVMARLGVQAYPTLVLLDSSGKKVYALDQTRNTRSVVQYVVRTFLISMYNSGARLKDVGRVRRAVIKFKWVIALGPRTPPAKWSEKALRRIDADGIKKLSQAAIAKDEKDYLKTMTLLDELVYEYRSTPAGRQAVRELLGMLKDRRGATAYREVIRRQKAERKLRHAQRLDEAKNTENALIVYWDVTRDYAQTPAAEIARKRADQIAADAELVERAKHTRETRDCRLWMEMAKAFEMNRRRNKALEYLDRILKYYPDTPAAKEAKTEHDRLANK